MMNSHCNICRRELNIENNPLSVDCGGDCWGCIGEMEADAEYEPSLEIVRQEYRDGYRKNWMPSPKVTFVLKHIQKEQDAVDITILLVRPLGEPWENENIQVKTFYKRIIDQSSQQIEQFLSSTNENGLIFHRLKFKPNDSEKELWVEIKRKKNSWAFPIDPENM